MYGNKNKKKIMQTPSSPYSYPNRNSAFFKTLKKISNSINLTKEMYGIHTKWCGIAENLNL